MRLFVLFAVALLIAATFPSVTVAQPATIDAQAIYQRALPSVATVRIIRDGRPGMGTGFVIDSSGLLLTASHVAKGAERVSVTLDQRTYQAQVLGYDARRDLAVLQVSARGLPALRLADSRAVRAGAPVVVLGARRDTVEMTTGALVSQGNSLPGLTPGALLRVSAPVMPGFSGGPLLDARGDVLGVVVASAGPRGEGGGVAVSSATVLDVLAQLQAGARIDRPWIGVMGRTLPPDLAQRRGLGSSGGVVILRVVPRSPAEGVGLRGGTPSALDGDVITGLDGRTVAGWDDLVRLVAAREPSQRVTLQVVRGQTRMALALTLGRRP